MHTRFLLVLCANTKHSHLFDGTHTFVLSDHALEFVSRQTNLSLKVKTIFKNKRMILFGENLSSVWVKMLFLVGKIIHI